MNRRLAGEIVGCLRTPAPQNLHFERWKARRDWEHTLEWLDHSGLALLFWDRLVSLGQEDAIPHEIGERLERNLASHRLRVAAMVEEFDSINWCLEKAGVKYVALKGFALIPEYSSDIYLRTTYDYDYLLPQDSVERAEAALKAGGYLRKEDPQDHPIVYFHHGCPPRTPLSRDDLYSAAFPRTVELHYLFWDEGLVKIPLGWAVDPLAQPLLRDLGAIVRPRELPALGRPVRFYALSEEDELIFQVLHAFRHILQNWCRLCSLLDIAYFLNHRALDTVFWDQFLERLGSSRLLSEIVGVVFLLAAGVFGAAIPASVSASSNRRLRRSLCLWVDRYGLDSAFCNFSENKFSLFLHREFIQDEADWREILRIRLFPMQRPNQGFQSSTPTFSSRFAASWRRGIHVAQRMLYHLMAAIRYGLESPRWNRARSRSR